MPDADPVAAYLDQIRERYNAGADFPLAGTAKDITDSSDDVPRLLTALDGVLALHHRDHKRVPFCDYCQDWWPCRTARAISAALLGEEVTDG